MNEWKSVAHNPLPLNGTWCVTWDGEEFGLDCTEIDDEFNTYFNRDPNDHIVTHFMMLSMPE